MNAFKIIFSAVIVLWMPSVELNAQDLKPFLDLWPKEISKMPELFSTQWLFELINSKEKKEVEPVLDTFSRDLAELGFNIYSNNKKSKVGRNVIEFGLLPKSIMTDEAYQLTVGNKISIAANTQTGLFWVTRTMLQLLKEGHGKTIPQLEIHDEPMLGYRGLLMDNARFFHSLDFHIKAMTGIFYYKMNKYQVRFSNHQSYTLPGEKFPKLPTKGQRFTKLDIAKLQEVAQKYHVEIILEIYVPGHSQALSTAIPTLNCTDAKGSATKLCISRESTHSTLKTLLSEVMEMFPGQYWHLGADEVSYDDLEAHKCSACRAQMEEKNFTKGIKFYLSFINEMHDFVKSKGRKMLVWEGFYPTQEQRIYKEITVCPFDIKYDRRTPHDYMAAGYKVLNTSWTPLYIVKFYMTTPKVLARWNPYTFGVGRSQQSLHFWQKYKETPLVVGAQMCSWENEEGAEEGMLFGTGKGFPEYGRPPPRTQIVAERIWTGASTEFTELLERLGESYWDSSGSQPNK